MGIVHRVSGLSKRVLGCTGTALDLLYKLTGRRVDVLHKSASILNDLVGEEEEASEVPYTATNGHAGAAHMAAEAKEEAVKASPEASAEEDSAKEASAEAASVEVLEEAGVEAIEASPEEAAVEVEASAAAPAADSVAEEAEAAEAEAPAEVVAKEGAPIEGYDAFNVKQVEAALEALEDGLLADVLAYEQAHKGRKTVVRLVERKIKSLQS